MERTGEENDLPNKSSASETKHRTGGVTHLRAIAGGLQPHHKQSQQRAQVRRFTALLNTRPPSLHMKLPARFRGCPPLSN